MGGNRPGGNNLAEIVMFGKMTGQFIAKGIKTKKILPLNEKIIERKIKWLADLTIHSKGENPITEKQKLQHMMMKRAGVMKNEKGFKVATGITTFFHPDLSAVQDFGRRAGAERNRGIPPLRFAQPVLSAAERGRDEKCA